VLHTVKQFYYCLFCLVTFLQAGIYFFVMTNFVLPLLLLVSSATSNSLQIVDDMYSDAPVSVSLTEIGCNEDDSFCSFGDQMNASGTLSLSSGLPTSSLCTKTKFCFVFDNWLCTKFCFISNNWFCKSLDDNSSVEEVTNIHHRYLQHHPRQHHQTTATDQRQHHPEKWPLQLRKQHNGLQTQLLV
jgi:hypothetical protein